MKGEKEQLKKAAESVGSNLKAAQPEAVKSAVQKATRKGGSPKDALGLTDAMIEGIYGQAYRLYNTGKYKEAGQIFRLLLMINAAEPKYSLGLAACFHMKKEFENAISAYTTCSFMDPESPIPYYHLADCYIQLEDIPSAIVALQTAVEKSGAKPEYKTLKDRAALMIEGMKKEFIKESEEAAKSLTE